MDTFEFYMGARAIADLGFDKFWSTHYERPGHPRPTITCDRTASGPCDCPRPEAPELEQNTARRVITRPLAGETFVMAFGRYLHALGVLEGAEHVSGQQDAETQGLVMVTWRLAVLTYAAELESPMQDDVEAVVRLLMTQATR